MTDRLFVVLWIYFVLAFYGLVYLGIQVWILKDKVKRLEETKEVKP